MNETGLDMFLNVSVNFPEINIVKYEFNKELIIIEVAFCREIDLQQEKQFKDKARKCIRLLHQLEENRPEVVEVKIKRLAGFTFLRYCRDVKSLSENEIALLISLLRENFCDCLVEDGRVPLTRDSLKKQVKHDLLQKLRSSCNNTDYLYAYHDQGRLCMFNR